MPIRAAETGIDTSFRGKSRGAEPSILGSFEHSVIVATVACGPVATACAIKSIVDSLSPEPRHLAAVITTLDRLSDKGLLESGKEDTPSPRKGGRKRRLFKITDIGQACLEYTQTVNERLANLARQSRPSRAA